MKLTGLNLIGYEQSGAGKPFLFCAPHRRPKKECLIISQLRL